MKTLLMALAVVTLGILLVSNSEAVCLDDSQNGKNVGTLNWEPAGEREDGELFPDDQNAGYSVHYTDTADGSKCERRIPDKTARTADFNLHSNIQYNFTARQWDTDGRVSIHSSVIPIMFEEVIVPIGTPASPTDVTVARIGESLEYQLNFPAVTTFDNGDPLPEGAVRKYYLFDSFAITESNYKGWVKDVYYATIPWNMPLEIGYHTFTMETEIKIGEQVTVSQRSTPVNVDVQVYVPPVVTPPNPPILIPIPEGAGYIEITFIE